MTVKELIVKLNEGNAVENVLNITQFISTSKKDLSADALVETVAYIKDGIICYDTNELELHTDITAIQLYTDLEFENLLEDYDSLLEHEVIDKIAELVGVDYVRYIRMIENKLEDKCRENNTVEGIIASHLSRITTQTEATLKAVQSKVEEADVKDISSSIGLLTKEVVKLLPSILKK